MEAKALISIIVPVYNVEKYLSRCIDSLLEQSYENIEVILIDDGSKDSSPSICDEYAAKDKRIRVIHKINGGLSSARNAGLDVARGEYIGFVDSDDWVVQDAYENMLNICNEYEAQLVCGGRYDVDSESGEKVIGLCPEKTEVVTYEVFLGRLFTWNGCDSAACDKLFHRSLFEKIRFPLGKVCEDIAIMYLVVEKAKRVALYNQPIYHYFHRPDSITTANLSEKTFHFVEHTNTIYPYILNKYETIRGEVRYFRINALKYSMEKICHAQAEDRKVYKSRYVKYRKELKEHLWFCLRSPLFSKKEKVFVLLLCTNLYRIGLNAWGKFKGRKL